MLDDKYMQATQLKFARAAKQCAQDGMRGSTTAATNSVSKFAAQRIMFDPHYYYFLFCTCLLLYSVLFWSAVAVRGAQGVGVQGLEKGSLLASLHRASQTSINFCLCECVRTRLPLPK